MGQLTFSVAGTFPIGTSVDAYQGETPANGGVPAGVSVATATVDSLNLLTFTGLDVRRHVATAVVSGTRRFIAFTPRVEDDAVAATYDYDADSPDEGDVLVRRSGEWTPKPATHRFSLTNYAAAFDSGFQYSDVADAWDAITADALAYVNANSSAYAVIYVPAGSYILHRPIAMPETPSAIGVYCEPPGARFYWPDDASQTLGAGEYAFSCNSQGLGAGHVANLHLLGPVAAAHTTRPNPTTGIFGFHMPSGTVLENCSATGFNIGCDVDGDHVRLLKRSAWAGNGFGLYWRSTVTSGDCIIENANLTDCWAPVGVAANSLIGGSRFESCHFGTSYFGIFGEAGGTPAKGILNAVTFVNCPFEGITNGVIYSEDREKGITSVKFINSGDVSAMTGTALATYRRDALIDVAGIDNCDLGLMGSGISVDAAAVLAVKYTFRNNTWKGDALRTAVASSVSVGVPLLVATGADISNDVHGNTLQHDGTESDIRALAGAVTVGDLLQAAGDRSVKRRVDATAAVVGVANRTQTDGYLTYTVRGMVDATRSVGPTYAIGDALTPDAAAPAKLTQAASVDEYIVGTYLGNGHTRLL